MPHPCNRGGLGPLLERDSLRSRHRSTAHGNGMIRDRLRQRVSQLSMRKIKVQKGKHARLEITDVVLLFPGPPIPTRVQLPFIRGVQSLDGQFRP